MIPTATYRVQFNAEFTFADAAALAPYWARLGISHLYASPIATARRGSGHGYDVVDPTTINAELGGEDGFRAMVAALRAEGLGVVLDIVPNHMGVGGADNAWWLDVLRKGQASAFAPMFDIDWAPADPDLKGKVLAPFLGAPYAEALAAGDLRLDPDRLSIIAHGVHQFPLRPEDEASVRAAGAQAFDPSTADGRARLHDLLERQHYRLAWWRPAGDAINWRRFFDITELAGLRVEDPQVFDAVHALPLRLYGEGLIQGLRVDHIDGLTDPPGYCRRLRAALQAAAPDRTPWLVVEKILGDGEALPEDWGVDGATGYEVMNDLSALLHDAEGAEPLTRLWRDVSGRSPEFEAEEQAARQEVLTRDFAAQLDNTARAFHQLAIADLSTRDVTLPALRRAVSALIIAMRVYRSYAMDTQLAPIDALSRAKLADPSAAAALEQMGQWLSGHGPVSSPLHAEAVRRLEQLSAPVAAKAVEDTAFYRYGRLLSRNDVGFDPGRLSMTPAAFAARAAERGQAFPAALLTTATHDHKRGEDVRARLAALSQIPDAWWNFSTTWLDMAPTDRIEPADAYMLQQMIVGAWPLDLTPDDRDGLEVFADRLAGWQRKALREAKLRTSWAVQNGAYEDACEVYLRDLLMGEQSRFRRSCFDFVSMIAPAGVANSLIQTGLRLTLPGVPDLYQGAEFWDFSLVDPDNRRPVDYAARRAALDTAPKDWRDGANKQGLIVDLLNLRRKRPDLFTAALTPIALSGRRSGQGLAFERSGPEGRLLVVAALQGAKACMTKGAPIVDDAWWGDTALPDARPVGELTAGAPFWWTLD